MIEQTRVDGYVPFIDFDETKTYECLTCLDYGGLISTSGECDHEGQPFTMACPDCGGMRE
jgi:hypothetical protein